MKTNIETYIFLIKITFTTLNTEVRANVNLITYQTNSFIILLGVSYYNVFVSLYPIQNFYIILVRA